MSTTENPFLADLLKPATRLNLTIPADLDAALTEWRRREPDVPDRQEAIRRIVQNFLQSLCDETELPNLAAELQRRYPIPSTVDQLQKLQADRGLYAEAQSEVLPRLIAELGIDKGTAEFKRRYAFLGVKPTAQEMELANMLFDPAATPG